MSLSFSGKNKSTLKIFLATTLLSTSLLAFAENKEIMCPPASFIKGLLPDLNTVSVHYGRWAQKIFYASAEDATFDGGSKLWWYVHTVTKAKDFNTAFEMGKQNLAGIHQVRNKYAQKSKDKYFCSYDDISSHPSIWAWGYENPDARDDLDRLTKL